MVMLQAPVGFQLKAVNMLQTVIIIDTVHVVTSKIARRVRVGKNEE